MLIPFTKMHGLGNDFVVIDARAFAFDDAAEFARMACDRRFGVGADQLLLLCRSDVAEFRMLIFNADGSEVEMCGNGIRCLAKYVWDRGLSNSDILPVETLAGIIRPERAGELIRVDMGRPVFEPALIPVSIDGAADRVIDFPVRVLGRDFLITCVSMGNPHAVIFLDEDPAGFGVPKYGPVIEHDRIFPRRTNVEFVRVLKRSEIVMRVWERGSGETPACGTGATGAAVAAMAKGLTDRRVTVHLQYGDLIIEWQDGGSAFMTGPAETVFEGSLDARVTPSSAEKQGKL